MRTGHVLLTATLLLAPIAAIAQTPQAPQAQTPGPAQGTAGAPFTGTIDVGGQFTGTDGDEARFERYRDSRSGAFTNLNINRQTDRYLFSAGASHIGYRDQ